MLTDLYLYRMQKDWSQLKLARVAGLAKHTIQRIESGDSVPRIDTVWYLAFALGVRPDDLFMDLSKGEDFTREDI